MLIEDFISGNYQKGIEYQFFVPNPINREWNWQSNSINKQLEKASLALGQLNSFAKLVPNIDLFIHLHITKEAVVSSRIEGTQTHFDEALLNKEFVNPDRRDDWQEVQNYTLALNFAIEKLKELPISSRLILQTHQTLMQGVRGERKTPGAYRKSQNWIGGASLVDAVFIPPHYDFLHSLMSDFEQFLHNEQFELPVLIKAAIMHYQFETIHPFLDGNGRMGRLLIPLLLIEKGVLSKPLLYLSHFFESNKSVYYDNLTRVRTHNDLLHWVLYFLVGIEQTANNSVQTLERILNLKLENENLIQTRFGRRVNSGLQLHQHLLKKPLVNISEVKEICNLSNKSAGDLVQMFIENGILKEFSRNIRNRIYLYKSYLDLFENDL